MRMTDDIAKIPGHLLFNEKLVIKSEHNETSGYFPVDKPELQDEAVIQSDIDGQLTANITIKHELLPIKDETVIQSDIDEQDSTGDFQDADRSVKRVDRETDGPVPIMLYKNISGWRNRSQEGCMKRQGHRREGKSYSCSQCSYETDWKRILTRHMRICHTEEMSFKCSLCHFGTNRQLFLVKHVKTHNGEKPYKCLLCTYETTRLSRLRDHVNTPYKCSSCAYTACRQISLTEHTKTHTDDKL